MATFTFSNDNRYYNPLCDSSLLYDDEDGDTNRKLCMETTCIAPIFEGTGRACEYLLPSGYEHRLFEWGVNDAAWTLNANYDGFPYLNNQFVEPFQITVSETGSAVWYYDQVKLETYVEGGITKTRKVARYITDSKIFNMVFKKVVPPKAGYQPMEGQDLAGLVLDAGSVGTSLLTGYSYNVYPTGIRWVCNTSMSKTFPPEISYFDIGSRQVPGSNTVTLKDAPITCMPVSGTLREDPYITDMTDFSIAWDLEHGAVAMTSPYMPPGYIACDTNANGDRPSRAVRATPYPITCVPVDGSSLTVDMSKYSTDRSNKTAYGENPYNGNWELGAFNKVKVSYEEPAGGLREVLPGVTFITTGYRVQKYISQSHSAQFYIPEPNIGSNVVHYESPLHRLGYTVTWEFVSATPKKYVVDQNSFKYSLKWRQVLIADAWPPFTTRLQWMAYEYTRTGTPTCRGDVQIKFTYTPHDYSIYYEYGPYTRDNPPNFIIGSNSFNGYNPPLYGVRSSSYYSDFLRPPINPLIASQLYYITNSYFTHMLKGGFSKTHTGDPMTGHKDVKSILNFKYPLKNRKNFSLNGFYLDESHPVPYQVYTPPNTAYLWRRLIGGLNPLQNTEVDYTYSNRKEWFNGTCPFTLKYDNEASDITYHPTQCSSSIKPIVIPTG